MDKKPVYLCKNIKELQQKSKISKYVTNSIMKTCETLSKVYGQYEKSLLKKDEFLLVTSNGGEAKVFLKMKGDYYRLPSKIMWRHVIPPTYKISLFSRKKFDKG